MSMERYEIAGSGRLDWEMDYPADHVALRDSRPGGLCGCTRCAANEAENLRLTAPDNPTREYYGQCSSCGCGPAGRNGLCGPCTVAQAMPWA